jgi:transposase
VRVCSGVSLPASSLVSTFRQRSEIKRIDIDTSKAVFTLQAVDEGGKAVSRVNLRRAQMIPFFRKCPAADIALEACSSSHHWARKLIALGHDVRLIPPQYVKPFVSALRTIEMTPKRSARPPAGRACLAQLARQHKRSLVLDIEVTAKASMLLL